MARTSAAGQLVALVAAGLVPVLTFVLARALVRTERLALSGAAAWAGLFMALTGQLWQSGMVVMSDTPALAAATASAIALVRYRETGRWGAVLLSAAALAAAILIRWANGLLSHRGWSVVSVDHREAGIGAAPCGTSGGSGPSLSVCSVRRSIWVTSSVWNGWAVLRGRSPASIDWSPLNAVRAASRRQTAGCRTRSRMSVLRRCPRVVLRTSPLAAPAHAVGVWSLARRRAAFALLLLAGWAGIVWAFHAGGGLARTSDSGCLPPSARILAGFGAAHLLSRPRRRVWAMAVWSWAIVAMAGAATRLCLTFVTRMPARVEIVRWVEAQSPRLGVLTFEFTPLFRTTRGWPSANCSGDVRWARRAQPDATPIYLLVDVRNLSTQWPSVSPGQFRWLRDGPGIVEIGARDGVTLFRVRRHVPDHMRSPDAATGQRN